LANIYTNSDSRHGWILGGVAFIRNKNAVLVSAIWHRAFAAFRMLYQFCVCDTRPRETGRWDV